MKRAWKIGMIFGVFICTILSSCYDKIDDFDILSGTEYVIYVPYFPEPDTIFVKSINSSFMYITNLSDNPKDNQPVYKAEIKNKHTSGVHQIILSLGSNMAEHRIYFNIK